MTYVSEQVVELELKNRTDCELTAIRAIGMVVSVSEVYDEQPDQIYCISQYQAPCLCEAFPL